MTTATMERLPNTVSACHAEIVRLRAALADASGAERIADLEAERDDLRNSLTAEQATVDELEERIEELEKDQHPEAVDAIHRFLAEVERPVGQFKFDVLHGPAADRAILGLYDAVERQP